MTTKYISNNSSNIDLIDYFLHSISYVSSSNITKSLTFTKINNEDNCLGQIIIDDKTTYTKSENLCYTCCIITDQSLIDILNIFSSNAIPMSNIYVSIEGVNYYCNSFISISNKNYYILKI